MRDASRFSVFVRGLGLTLLLSLTARAQFTGSIQGIVIDQTGAGVPKAAVTLVNNATQVAASTATDASGNYRFVSLAPGSYKLTAEAPGFSKSAATVRLLTEQNLSVPLTLKVGAATEAVTVTAETPVVDTADSRNELTLENNAVAQLPVPGRNLVTLTTLAPGVSGLGTMGGGQPGKAGTPGSGVDNYSTETQVDASANGQGQMSNMYVIDGLDVTSGIRQGVLNLTPNPESIQETSVQVNTYSSEYSRATGVQEVLTTKSGSDQFPAVPRQQHVILRGRPDCSSPPILFLLRGRAIALVPSYELLNYVRRPAVHYVGTAKLPQYCGNQGALDVSSDWCGRR